MEVFHLDWVEHAMEIAVQNRASDIHIEPGPQGYQVRIRQDGDLQQVSNLLPCELSAIQRIKVLANMDIAERRLPQDGSFQVQTQEGLMDVRVSSLPTVEGEKLVLRLLRHSSLLQHLDQLRMDEAILQDFRLLLKQSHGMIIATGPTGSGKSTTLFAALRFLHDKYLNIVTLEDPVESRISGINQVQINERAGLTFAKGLRSILRQDPDVIMVGEIRDSETAEIAIRAALTGHLVLTTLHTDSAEVALVRLVDLGVEHYLVSSAVRGVLNQRLVKNVKGGRRAVFDLLLVDNRIREWLRGGANLAALQREDMLKNSLKKLITQGEVGIEEYVKLYGGDGSWLCSMGDGKVIESSPDFVHDWQGYYEADFPFTRA